MVEGNKKNRFFMPVGIVRDDRILPETRRLAALIIPFLVVAFIILYFWPNDTDKLFARTIKPSMTPMMLAAAYLGGIYFFTRAILEKRWSAARIILEAQAFSIVMILIATARAWGDFEQSNAIPWLFVGGLSFLLLALAALYASIEIYRRNAVKGHSLNA